MTADSRSGNNRLGSRPRDPWLREQMGAGKGDRRRPVNKKKYDEGYERIFGKKEHKLKGTE